MNTRGLVEAVNKNDINCIKALLKKPEYLKQAEETCHYLLQTAIQQKSKKVFDYFLTLDVFRLDSDNNLGELTISLAIQTIVSTIFRRQIPDYHYIFELINKGAPLKQSYLQTSVNHGLLPLVSFLLDKGLDINILEGGNSVLHHVVQKFRCRPEEIGLLLSHGADPFIENNYGYIPFELAVIYNNKEVLVKNILFFYTFDEYTQIDIHLEVLCKLAEDTEMFKNVINHVKNVKIGELTVQNIQDLCNIDTEIFEILVNKCSNTFDEALELFIGEKNDFVLRNFRPKTLENLNFLMSKGFDDQILNYIRNLDSKTVFSYIVTSSGYLRSNQITEVICFFLSYGLQLEEFDLQVTYKKYGYWDLFKILLHMDYQISDSQNWTGANFNRITRNVLPFFIYNVTLDLHTYLLNPDSYCTENLEEILAYFTHPQLKEYCYRNCQQRVITKAKKLPRIPRLLQLARDSFRKAVVTKFGFTNSRQFYYYLNRLPIDAKLKKVVTFEKKLYKFNN